MNELAVSHYPGMEGVEYCPVSIGAKLIADRWSLLIVRELMEGASRFNEIHRGLPGLSKSLLASRLRQLERQRLISHQADGTYHLTAAGVDLRPVLIALGEWTVRWRFPAPTTQVADSPLLLWRMFQALRIDRLPRRRVTIELAFSDATPDRGWFILDGHQSSLCMEPPGTDIDLVVAGSVVSWLRVMYGRTTLTDEVANGHLRPIGPPELVDELKNWFELSAFATAVAQQAGLERTASHE